MPLSSERDMPMSVTMVSDPASTFSLVSYTRTVSLDQHLAASLTKPIEKMHLGHKGNARRERVQRVGGSKSNTAFAPILIDPFSTEEGFEDDLDCGVLFTPPQACSTPRLFGRGRPARRSRHSEDSDDILSLFLQPSMDRSEKG